DPRVHGIRLARNSGSHAAIRCGLADAVGDAAAMLAADLQDPPDVLRDLVARWREGAQIVWAARRVAPGSASNTAFATVYYGIMRLVIGMKDMPSAGADCFLLDRAVIDTVSQYRERNVSVLALITWLGFRQARVEYDKQQRLHGTSGWSLRKKVTLV